MNYRHTHRLVGWIQAFTRSSGNERAELLSRLTHQHTQMAERMDTEWSDFKSNVDYYVHVTNLLRLYNNDSRTEAQRLDAMGKYAARLKRLCPRIKVVFFAQEFSLWPSFQSVWEYFQTLENVECKLVFSYDWEYSEIPKKDYDAMLADYQRAGYPAIQGEDFSLMDECPDMAFYMKPYYRRRSNPHRFYVTFVKPYVPYSVFISYCLDVQGGERLFQFFYQMSAFYHMWRIVGYSRFYVRMMTERGFRNGENVRMLGHPKFDLTYRLAHGDRYVYPEWEAKIAGRPVVLWNSHFSIRPGEGVGTFYRWRDTIFTYFREHSDIVLLWRPHPLFWEIIQKASAAEQFAFEKLLRELENQENLIVDRTGDYQYAFCASHALISDATTFLMEYRPSRHPILYTPKPDGESTINPEYTKGLTLGLTPNDLIAFLEGVRLGTLQEASAESLAVFEDQAGVCDGRIGERIANKMLLDMDADILANCAKEDLP